MKYRGKKSLLIICIVLGAVVTFGAMSKSRLLKGKQLQSSGVQLPDVIADGAKQPDAIPDWVAYDILVHTITTPVTATTREKQVAANLAKEIGLGGVSTSSLQRAASNSIQEILVLDRQVAEIKDRYWPKPGNEVIEQLNDLQKQKEAILEKFVADLPIFIGADGAQILRNYIRANLKSKIKAFKEVPIERYQHH